jgi:hypothetical protein
MSSFARKLVSAVVGFLAMFAIARIFDRNDWPGLNSWGMAHGGFFVVWPALGLVCFIVLTGISRK